VTDGVGNRKYELGRHIASNNFPSNVQYVNNKHIKFIFKKLHKDSEISNGVIVQIKIQSATT
jgi:hypothetical protein